MFYCEITKRMSRPGQKCNKVVIAKREILYTTKVLNEETGRLEKIDVSKGWEVVKEVNATDEGVRLWEEKGSPVFTVPRSIERMIR